MTWLHSLGVLLLFLGLTGAAADEPVWPRQLVGYTELQTNLSGGRHANVRTMRAAVMQADGSGRRLLTEELANEPDAWTQFAGWSPDGRTAIVIRGWQSAENAQWEEKQRQFRMEPGKWLLDSYLLNMATEKLTNITAVDRVSHYNGGLFFLPEGRGLGFTPLIHGVSKPFVMDLDGRNKRDVSGKGGGFAYGYSASPDGKLISYHENYQVFIADADGSNKRHIVTGNPFDFAPRWSPDGQWLLFVSGVHGRSNPYIVGRDGTGLRELADLGSYQGWTSFLDVEDFHQGSSDLPVWSADGKSVFYTAKAGENVELFRTTLDGTTAQLTETVAGTLHYHPEPSADGNWLLYGSMRDGARQLYVMRLSGLSERRLTDLKPGHAAMWPHWQPIVANRLAGSGAEEDDLARPKIVKIAEAKGDIVRNSEATMVELADRRLLMIWQEFEKGTGDSDFFPGRLAAMTSDDGGRTWGGHRVVVRPEKDDINVYSPSLVRLQGGKILFCFMRYHSFAKAQNKYPPASAFAWISRDEGQTFRPLATLWSQQPITLCNSTLKRLSSGRILIPVCRDLSKKGQPDHWESGAYFSDDGGVSWQAGESWVDLPKRGAMEPHVEELRDGRLLMVMRTQLGAVYRSISADGGKTWGQGESLGIEAPESCPELARIPSTGDLLLIWNASKYDPQWASHFGKRTPLSAAVSKDDGQTWSVPHHLEADPGSAFSNPGVCFTSAGTAIVNYWTCQYQPSGLMSNYPIHLKGAIVPLKWLYSEQPSP